MENLKSILKTLGISVATFFAAFVILVAYINIPLPLFENAYIIISGAILTLGLSFLKKKKFELAFGLILGSIAFGGIFYYIICLIKSAPFTASD